MQHIGILAFLESKRFSDFYTLPMKWLEAIHKSRAIALLRIW
jgi:hypothetical protein